MTEEKNAQEKVKELEEELMKDQPSDGKTSELKDVEKSPGATNIKPSSGNSPASASTSKPKEEGNSKALCSNPYLQLVVLLFMGECGDRTQLAAIALTVTHNPWGIAVGGALVRKNETNWVGNGSVGGTGSDMRVVLGGPHQREEDDVHSWSHLHSLRYRVTNLLIIMHIRNSRT